jgi:hydrogenase maturation protein HypF
VPETMPDAARKWLLGGRVQGVGFRPFVYRVAQRCGVRGWVRNSAGAVEILAQGEPERLQRFGRALLDNAPPLARPEILREDAVEPEAVADFHIRPSETARPDHIHVPPDQFACDECLSELADPHDRRYRYPFINCTQCGPRYTLIERLPYDRVNTSMAGFALCPDCVCEYADPSDRRFHAEPIACPRCGPQLEFRDSTHSSNCASGADAFDAAIAALRSSCIVAVKGIGGYHLVCDAANTAAVAALRARKRRPHKPLAVMFPLDPGLASLRRSTRPSPLHVAMLRDPIRPIVLVPKNDDGDLAPEIAPGSGEIGAMLPYSPLHHMLAADFGGPLVATSGNISGEPVLTDNQMAERRLGTIADAFLHHDRPIVRPADDPVYRVIAGKPRLIRLGRGNAPLEIDLPWSLPHPMLALGGHLKNTIALGWGNRAVISPHLGDMDTHRGRKLLEQVAADLQSLYGVTAQEVLCDAHPGYATTRIAATLGLPTKRIYHHEAHASALAGEYAPAEDWLVFAWDGAGFGRDGTIWGGEALLGRPGRWQRVATLRSFALIGGERAAREPWRSALALCWEAGREWRGSPQDTAMLHHAWSRKLNCPRTSSIGRLFDGAAALLGLVTHATYEGQAPSRLEAACGTMTPAMAGAEEVPQPPSPSPLAGEGRGGGSGGCGAEVPHRATPTPDPSPQGGGEKKRASAISDHPAIPPVALPLHRRVDGILETDWAPFVDQLQDERLSVPVRAAMFHATLAELLLAQARAIRREHGVMRLGLTGGVFQNRVLCELISSAAAREGFVVHIPEKLPCNDAGLSFGQLIEGSAPS